MNTLEQEQYLFECISNLDKLNKRMAKLNVMREELVDEIINGFSHAHEGQKTYEFNHWKIEIKTPFTYSLNKTAYKEHQAEIPKEFNPVKESITYTIDKKMLDKCIDDAPIDVRDLLVELIDKKPGKPSVAIKERV